MGFFRAILIVFIFSIPSLAAGQAARSKSEVFSALQGEWINARGDVFTEIDGEVFTQITATPTNEFVEEKGVFALQRICPVNLLRGPILVFRSFEEGAWCYKLVLVEPDKIEFVETEAEYPDTWYRPDN